jgi:hypothetical protein
MDRCTYVQTVHLLTITMQSAFDTIIDTYDYEQCKEIVNHGCRSGVCSQHIYYGDTIEFFTKYPDEITSFIKDNLGIEGIQAIMGDADGNYDQWMNDMTWAFIELVAMQVVDDYEDAVPDLDGFNPSRSMTESRYAQV